MRDVIEITRNIIMDCLDPIGVVVGIVVSIPIFWTWWSLRYGKKRKHREWLSKIRSGKTVDAILIVDLLPDDDMSPKVLKYLKKRGLELEDEKIFKMTVEVKTTPEELPQRVEQLRNTLAEISRLAPGNLHVFYGGPAAFSMLMGAEMANKGNVIVYQHTEGEYVNWGPIRHAHF